MNGAKEYGVRRVKTHRGALKTKVLLTANGAKKNEYNDIDYDGEFLWIAV